MKSQQDPAVKNLLDTAQKAAETLRKEQGLLTRFMNWLELRSERKHNMILERQEKYDYERALARCRNNEHDFQHWKEHKLTTIYADGSDPKTSLPIARHQSWEGRCITCGCPNIITKKV